MANIDEEMISQENKPAPRTRSTSVKRPASSPLDDNDPDLVGFVSEGLTSTEIEAKLKKVAANLETEIAKRRDLADLHDVLEDKMRDTRQLAKKLSQRGRKDGV